MIFRSLVFALPLLTSLTTTVAAAQEVPPGFTLYSIQGEGVNAPPFPLRVEGDRVTSPPDTAAVLRVTESRLTPERAWIVFETPGGPATFVGVRQGAAFSGLVLLATDRARVAAPVQILPAGQEAGDTPDLTALASGPGISRVVVVPGDAALRANESRRFVARAFDEQGREVTPDRVEWYASAGRITAAGEYLSAEAGQPLIVARVDDAVGVARARVSEPRVASLHLSTPIPQRLAAGSRVVLEMDALTESARWELAPDVQISSSDPAVLAVEGTALVARSPGRATISLEADDARETHVVEVVPAEGDLGIGGLPSGPVLTGQVVRLETTIADARPLWAVAGGGAQMFPDGAFVAEEPGLYTVIATLGDRVTTAVIEARPRGLSGRVHIVGHGTNLGTFTSDLWPSNGYVYLGTHQANQVRTYDVSDPAAPVLTDSLTFDARVINDVKVSPDGRWLVATREGASNRRNGILVLSLEDPAHPRLVSEYTETLTGGVHNVFWVGELIYAVNDGTGDMHIIGLSDPRDPREVGRWGLPVVGHQLHDVWVQDGIAYLSYLRDGLVILDVGGAGKGGTPEKPVVVSRIFYPGGPTHSALRYGDYVFVGDEDFSLQGTVPQIPGLGADPRGPIHVIDVSDLEHPRYVARYEVPEAGAHNFWIQDGLLFVGYYQGGIRVVDVEGDLRGDLYRQGREVSYFLPAAGPEAAKIPYATMVWGVFPMFETGWKPAGDVFYASDYNSGLWSFRLEREEGASGTASR